MNTRGFNARRAQKGNVNDEVPPQVPQGPQDLHGEGDLYNVEIRAAY